MDCAGVPTPEGWSELMDLFELGHTHFKALTQELAAYGLHVDPALEVRRTNGLLCYYNLKDGHIYLSVPGLETPATALCTVALCATLDCSLDELLRFWPLFMPYLIAHELAHHLRHRAGLFGPSLWHEEQIANKLGMALTRHRCRPDERAFVLEILTRGMRALGAQVPSSRSALLPYDGVLDALHALGTLGDDDHRYFAVLERLFARSP